MSFSTVIQQGKFTADGAAKSLDIRSDVDWMEVYNYTQAATQQATGRGVQFYWQRGMASDTGMEYKKTNSTDALNLVTLTSGGFTLVDSSDDSPQAQKTGTTITKANPAVATVSTHGYNNGDVVRIYSSDNMDQINGLDFTIGSVSTNTFTLAYLNTNIANFTASTAFYARKIPYSPLFYPARRIISAVTTGSTTTISMTVTHGYTAGQVVRLHVPSDFGMVELDGQSGEILSVNTSTNTIVVDIDSSAYTAFGWPAATAAPLTWAEVVPFGDFNTLDGATENVGFIGMSLAGGAQSPAGSASDVIYWKAGKSLVVDNE